MSRLLLRIFSGSSLVMLLCFWGSAAADTCPDSEEAAVWISEGTQDIRVKGVTTDRPADRLVVVNATGEQELKGEVRGGPPWSLTSDLPSSFSSGRVELRRGDEVIACASIDSGSTRSSGSGWTRPLEAYYSAWIEQLFDGPNEAALNFKSLEPVIRDPERNFLWGHLGQNEDQRLPAVPDCADLPYYLRTYFAWKMGLPVAYRACDRGTANHPPSCGAPTLDDRFTRGSQSAAGFTQLMRQIANTVHSGSARTGLASEKTDFYPLPLRRDALWPGTVYADPYGHTLIIAKWVPQTAERSGILFAADAQPDNSVARKRFWEGNFLFANSDGAGPGFKQFRPIEQTSWGVTLLNNDQLSQAAPVAPLSLDQGDLDPESFYARMALLINPQGLSPETALDTMLDALQEQVETRVGSVNNGEQYLRQHRGTVIAMPSGAGIFEAMGPWEDYATPSRDMRLLIAIKVLTQLPSHIDRHPELYRGSASGSRIVDRLENELQARKIQYTRTDGSTWSLSLKAIVDRKAAFETAYNPNDCVEIRWGAEEGSSEALTCQRRAPADQRAKLEQYRRWFHQTQRPSR